MTNKSTKRALLTSIMAMLLCCSMLVGTTFAWFTDSVTSKNNLIVAGNLDVELYNGLDDTAPAVNENTKLFEEVTLWEPGAVAYENFTVANEGDLALKYQLAVKFTNATQTTDGKTLADVLKIAVIPGGFTGDREAAKNLIYNYSLSTFAKVGELLAGADPDVYGIVIYWEPTSNDNDYNMNKEGQTPLEITLGISLFATQLSAELEKDSFDNLYDSGLELPDVDSSTANVKADGSATMEANVAPSANNKKTTISAPAGAFATTDKVEVDVETTNKLFEISANGGVVASLDITFTVNGEASSADLADGKVYTITTYVSKGLANVSLDYTGTDEKDEPNFVSYNAETGELVFTTNHFSNYDVNAIGLAYDAENDTALTTLAQIIEARNEENKQVLIPEGNLNAIEEEIAKLPENEREDAIAATYAASIGENYYTSLADALKAAVDGDTVVILNDLIIAGDWDCRFTGGKTSNAITIDGNNKTLKFTGTVSDGGNHHAVFRFENAATVKDLTFDLSNAKGYNNRVRAIAAKLDLTVENCTFIGNSELTNDRAIIYGEGAGTALADVEISVTGCEFINWRKGISDNENAQDAKTVIVKSNSFKNAGVGISASESVIFTGNTMDNGDVSITSYTNLDALKLVLENNKLDETKDNTLGKTAYVVTANSLVKALEKNLNVVFNSDIKIDPANMSNAYGKTGINVKNGQTIDGNGHVLDIKGAGGTWDSGINTTGGTIKNITVTGSFRGIFINHNSTQSSRVILENVITDGTVYTISCDQGSNQGLTATDCTFNGWTSYAATLGDAEFIGCTFSEGSGYAFCRPYAPTAFVGCDFEAGFEMDPRAAVTFENCTLDGVALTDANIATLVTSNIANVTSVK